MTQWELAYLRIGIFFHDSKKLIEDYKNYKPVDIDKWIKDACFIDGLIPHIVEDMTNRYNRITMSQEVITKYDLDNVYIRVDIDSIYLFDNIVHNVSDKYISMAKDEYAKVMSSYIDKHDNVIQENGISEWNNKINLIKID